MAFKINIGTKEGKTYKLELESEELNEKSLHDKIQGKDLLPILEGYEFEITGASDSSGFTAMESVPGIGLKKILLSIGKAMHRRSRGLKKKKQRTHKGLRLRRTVRGRVISPSIVQVNLKVIKEGSKPLNEIFGKGKEEAPAEVQ